MGYIKGVQIFCLIFPIPLYVPQIKTWHMATYLINFYSFAFLISVTQNKIKKTKKPKHLTTDPPPPKFASSNNKRSPTIHHHNQHSFGFLFFCLISKSLKLSAPIFWSRSANSSHNVKWISLEVWLFMVCWVG